MAILPRSFIELEERLKQVTRLAPDQKPVFNWRAVTPLDIPDEASRFVIEDNGAEREIDVADIAERIGNALTDLLIARQQEDDIYSQQNRTLVSGISRAVVEELVARCEGKPINFQLAEEDLEQLIERTLIRNNAHDLARSLIMGTRTRLASGSHVKVSTKVIRRNGDVVPWNQNKLEIAVRKAFLSLEMDSDPAVRIADSLSRRMIQEQKPFIHIEDLQDLVQEELMRQGFYKAAEAYILYRSHRNEIRRQTDREIAAKDLADDSKQGALVLVGNPDGSTELWDGQDLRKRIEFAILGLDLGMDVSEIEHELRRSIANDIKREGLRSTIIMNARSLIEKDADFAPFAARILLTYIYEEVTGWNVVTDGIEALPQFHRRAFKRNLQRGVEIGRYTPRLLAFDLDRLADALDPAADLDFDYLGIQTLYDRYLVVDKSADVHCRLETPQMFWLRVAMGLFIGDQKRADAIDQIIALYRLYKSRRFCSSTPTLFNSGTNHSQLSSCYLYKVDDSIESIMIRGISENAFLSKWAGGLGGSWTAVRGTGSHISGTNGESQGVIPFLKLHNDQLVAVNQGGKRRGSGCAYLETWHNDIFDFLKLRVTTGDDRRRAHDMNTANWIPDLFMKRLEARADWTLFRSNEVPDLHDLYGKAFEKRYVEWEEQARLGKIWSKTVSALDLWKELLKVLFETGHPWITFKDPCNVRSPQDHVGVIHSSNLCTEITLNTSEDETAVCNLGSIVLENHLDENGNIDQEKLRETIRIAVRALDNVIDINFYPTEAARRSNMRHRPIGLGVMGLQYALFRKNLAFSSPEAIEFNDVMMESIAYYAYEASSDLAAERGTYSTFRGSKWDRGLLPQDTLDLLEQERGEPIEVPRGGTMDWDSLRAKIKAQGMRNSNVIAIAPTATISNIMGSCPCIEPLYKNLFTKSNLSGEFVMLNPYLVKDLKAAGLWDQDMARRLKYHDGEIEDIEEMPRNLKLKYATAFSVPWKAIIESAARRQKWIDQSQSTNLWLKEPDLKSLSHMYKSAWRSGLKTTYYLRTLQASNIEKATVEIVKEMRGSAAVAAATVQPIEGEKVCSLEARMRGEECEACQ